MRWEERHVCAGRWLRLSHKHASVSRARGPARDGQPRKPSGKAQVEAGNREPDRELELQVAGKARPVETLARRQQLQSGQWLSVSASEVAGTGRLGQRAEGSEAGMLWPGMM